MKPDEHVDAIRAELAIDYEPRFMVVHRKYKVARLRNPNLPPVPKKMVRSFTYGKFDASRYRSTSGHELGLSSGMHTYKTLKNAKVASQNMAGDEGLVLRFRPDELEPVNISANQRVAFAMSMIDRWMSRLLESGLSNDEVAVYCESLFLKWGTIMKDRLNPDVM